MMGQHTRAESLFYYFRLEDHVPEDHLLRLVDRHIDFAFVRETLKASYHRVGVDQGVPRHSTFSKNRHGRFQESALFLDLFERVVKQCMEVGLLKGADLSVDSTQISADARRQMNSNCAAHIATHHR